MKIALLGDTHFDVKNGDEKVLEMQLKFILGQFIPYCVENEIKTVIQLGDMTNNRTYLSLNIIHGMVQMFDAFLEAGIKIIYLDGNHDLYYKDSHEINSMEIFEKAYCNINRVVEPTIVEGIQIVPWLCKGEHLEILPGAKAIAGHFEMKDFYVTKSFKSEHGIDRSVFKNLPVFSGHYHIKQDVGNIHYIGTPYQLDWNDFNTIKGFGVVETETMYMWFIENESTPKHVKILLDVDNKTIDVEGYSITSEKFMVDNFIKQGGLFGSHKIKVYAKKDLAITKKLVEFLEEKHQVKLEIVPENEVVDIEERMEQVKSMSIVDNMLAIVDDDDKSLTSEIIEVAKGSMTSESSE